MSEPSHSLPASAVTILLEQLAGVRGYPDVLRIDNGSRLTSRLFREWADKQESLLKMVLLSGLTEPTVKIYEI